MQTWKIFICGREHIETRSFGKTTTTKETVHLSLYQVFFNALRNILQISFFLHDNRHYTQSHREKNGKIYTLLIVSVNRQFSASKFIHMPLLYLSLL